MTYTARLYIEDCLYRTIEVPRDTDYISIQAMHRMTPLLNRGGDDIPRTLPIATMLFRLDNESRQTEWELRYQFESAAGQLRISHWEVHEEMPVTLDEPDENVNLDKLKAKAKSGGNIKEMISRFLAV